LDWLLSNGEIYHHGCTGWTTSAQSGTCERCGVAIPEATRRVALEQRQKRMRDEQNREIERSLESMTRQVVGVQARVQAILARPRPVVETWRKREKS
jgi:hypothetical protein